jgi:hypothetical protein
MSLSRHQSQFRSDQRLLVYLRALQGVLRVSEIGHRVLAIFVEKQLVELPRQVIVVNHVFRSAGSFIDLVQPGQNLLCRLAQGTLAVDPARVLGVAHHEQDEIANIVRRLDDHSPIHVGLAGADAGVLRHMHGRALVGEANPKGLGGPFAITVFATIVVDNDKLALADQPAQHLV